MEANLSDSQQSINNSQQLIMNSQQCSVYFSQKVKEKKKFETFQTKKREQRLKG